MKPGTGEFLQRAADTARRAARMKDAGAVDAAAGAAFYAMLYAAKALLNQCGLRLRTHDAVCEALGKHYVETGRLDLRFQHALATAVGRRRARGEELDVGFEETERMIEEAEEFLAAARACLGVGSEGGKGRG